MFNPLYNGFDDSDKDFILEIFERMEYYVSDDERFRGSFFTYAVPMFDYTKKQDYTVCDMLFEIDPLWQEIQLRVENPKGDGFDWRDDMSNVEFIEYLATNHIDYFRAFGFVTRKEVDALLEEYYLKLSNARKSSSKKLQ